MHQQVAQRLLTGRKLNPLDRLTVGQPQRQKLRRLQRDVVAVLCGNSLAGRTDVKRLGPLDLPIPDVQSLHLSIAHQQDHAVNDTAAIQQIFFGLLPRDRPVGCPGTDDC